MVLIVGPALACRGTAEYPQIFVQLEQSKSSPARVETLMAMLSQGQTMHKEGHQQGDIGKLLTSLRILDDLKGAIAPWKYDFGTADKS